MGKVYDSISEDLRAWLAEQKVFFVATAPNSPDAHINLSPKGGDTFRVLGEREVCYLDLTGSGIETAAHVQENGRIVVMFCAFTGGPKIVRLHGKGEVIYPKHPDYARLLALFPDYPGARAILRVAVSRVSDSCGYAVPFMDFIAPRDVLDKWAMKAGPEEVAAYRARKNATSIDGIPGYQPD
jgi:hypothetical protein